MNDRIYVFETDAGETIAFFWTSGPQRTNTSIEIPIVKLNDPLSIQLWDYKGNELPTPSYTQQSDTILISGLKYSSNPIILKVGGTQTSTISGWQFY